jgi:hypothetical protein
MLLWVPGNSRVQGNGDADVLARKGQNNPLLGLELAILISPCVDRLKVKEWLNTGHHARYETTCTGNTAGW